MPAAEEEPPKGADEQPADAAQPPNAEREPANVEDSKRLGETSNQFEELDRKKVAREIDPRNAWERFWFFVSSGFFFMIVGVGFLAASQSTFGQVHSSFTFVLIVVGIAVLLYGTGTQSFGEFQGQGHSKYSVALAGGAGVLAFAIGAGIVTKRVEIRDTFTIQTAYGQYRIAPSEDGLSAFRGYAVLASIDGEPLAAYIKGDYIVVHVPFRPHLPGEAKLRLRLVAYEDTPPSLSRDTTKDLVINHTKFVTTDGGLDFAKYTDNVEVTLVRQDSKPSLVNAEAKQAEIQGTDVSNLNLPEALPTGAVQ